MSGPAARALTDRLPEAVAAAVIEFVTGPLINEPLRVGAPLRRELEGLYAARRGTFRVLYSIDEPSRVVTVFRIEHRSDVYRRR
ncbi:MAG: type II toxin-antitoxin system RelE family toxin [Acidimicrobiales bacterium]